MIASVQNARCATLHFSHWYIIIGWAVLLLALPLWPASFWFEVNSVIVTDSYTEKGHRIIDVDREVKREFYGKWRVEEQLKVAGSGYVTVQICEADSHYRPEKGMPAPITLEWWKGNRCRFEWPYYRLIEGTYRICTYWMIEPEYFPRKKVDNCGPDFTRSQSLP